MKKLSFEEIYKMYGEHMVKEADAFFESSNSGWTNKEFVEHITAERDMILEYNEIIKPLIESGAIYLNQEK